MNILGQSVFNPKIWSALIAIVIGLFLLLMAVASVGPIILAAIIVDTDGYLSIGDVLDIAPVYIGEAAEESGVDPKIIRNSTIANAIICLPAIFICIYVLKRREWARKSFVVLLVLLIAMPIVIHGGDLNSFRYIANTYSFTFVVMIWYLQKTTTKEIFKDVKSNKAL